MKYARLVVVLAIVFSVGSTAWADWDPSMGHKMHFPQFPDISPNGMDVLATWGLGDPGANQIGKIVADDWRCSQTGTVSDIHIWGSWLYDRLPQGADGTSEPSAKNVRFKLSIHDDVRAGDDPNPNVTWSHPGQELWQRVFEPGDAQVTPRLVATLPVGAEEKFYDPNTNLIIGTDREVYQYNFLLTDDGTEPLFHQEEGKIYWLDVQAEPIDTDIIQPPLFGWKTSDRYRYPAPWTGQHFMDDAVFGDNDFFGGPPTGDPPWTHMHYPDGHQFEGQSFDQAFVVTPEPATMSLLCIGGLALLRRRRR